MFHAMEAVQVEPITVIQHPDSDMVIIIMKMWCINSLCRSTFTLYNNEKISLCL